MIITKSADTYFLDRVSLSALFGVVHSVFKRTINITCLDDNELYTIGCEGIDNAPNTLIVNLRSFEDFEIGTGNQVYINDTTISIGNKLSIPIKGVKLWESILPAYPANTNALQSNLLKMRQYIESHGQNGGIKRKPFAENSFEHELERMIHERTNLLKSALMQQELIEAQRHAISLLGLGPGLTPSGDDFLVGLFAVLCIRNSPCASYTSICGEIVQKAKTATNEISYMAIKKASEGLVRESLISLLVALLYGNEEELTKSLQQVLNIGSSSGTDIALGILCGLEVNINCASA
ncbi:DUF2877 domain-containing protein [Bacillus ndiopicus]|uniref:DUF2877 domain-containing protein n=1 Tax=Bacillus ndiopicus TaxID=1347368 RepID=UPI0005A6B6AD|nr:DUF2877 domain-containing protein [Bacillus ndiopicus]